MTVPVFPIPVRIGSVFAEKNCDFDFRHFCVYSE